MAYFDQKLWNEIGLRLASALPPTRIDAFALGLGLEGVRLDRIAKGRKGTSVETMVAICEKLDLSASWLLFGKGPRRLSDLGEDMSVAEQNLNSKKLVHHILEGATSNVLERMAVSENPAEYDESPKAGGKARSFGAPAPRRAKGGGRRRR